ncbi:MAG: hypothetical protein ACK4NZ_01680, partial [Tsuneonella sp.]
MTQADENWIGHVVGTDGAEAMCLFDLKRLGAARAANAGDTDNTSIGAFVRIDVERHSVFGVLVQLARDDI